MKRTSVGVLVGLLLGVVWTSCRLFDNPELPQLILPIENWAYQLQDAEPDSIAGSGFDLIVMDYSRDGSDEMQYSPQEVQQMAQSGVMPVAYLSIGEAEDYRFYWDSTWYTQPPDWLGNVNPDWEGNFAVKYWDPEWQQIVFSYIDRIIDQGFVGLYLDKIDEYEYWSDSENGESLLLSEEEAAQRMIDFIIAISDYAREKVDGSFLIIPQNGDPILAYDDGTLLSKVSGWGAEDLFYNGTELWDSEEAQWISQYRLPHLEEVRAAGLPVLSVDYVDDGTGYSSQNKARIDQYRQLALSHGFIPYVALENRTLDILHVIPGVQP